MDHYSYYNYYLNICADLGCIYEYVCMYAYIYTDIWHMSIHMGSGQDGLCTSFKDDHRSNGHSEHVEATNLISIGGYPKNVGHKKIYMYWMYIYIYFMNMSNLFPTHTHIYAHAYTIVFHFFNPIERHTNSPWPTNNLYMELVITKGSVSYLSYPCFSTSLGGIGGPARAIHGILAVMYWISIIRGGAPPLNSHGWRGHGPPH
jgi:hypothetical protein